MSLHDCELLLGLSADTDLVIITHARVFLWLERAMEVEDAKDRICNAERAALGGNLGSNTHQ